ncbi:MAG: FecR domain-containing protein [Tunicatimonas sp.]
MAYQEPLRNQLLRDETFFQWVHRSDPAAVDYWENWLVQHPEHRETVADAARLVRGIPFAPQKLSEEQVHRAWLDLQARLPHESASQPKPFRRVWLRAAAAIALLALAGSLVWWKSSREIERTVYTTAYGETRLVHLPDGSEVILNAHSRLTYQRRSDSTPRREVWIDGEAFFTVKHLGDTIPVPFVVHTPDLRVQVLGTKFNVNTRRGRTQVVLDRGKVALRLPTQKTTPMQPGELAEYTAQASQVQKKAVDTELFTAWRDRRLKFDDTPLSEVALVLEENYGVRVVFDSPSLRDKRVTGEISAQKIDTILRALSTLFSISVARSGNTVHFHLPS